MINRAIVPALLLLALAVTGCSSGSTDAATGITPTAVSLNGTIIPDGDGGRSRFEWRRPTDSAANTTPWRTVASPGTTSRVVSERLTGLTPNTRYAFRLCGEETTGARPAWKPDRLAYTCGAIREFTTAATPGRPTAEFRVSPSPSRAGEGVTLDWTGSCPAGPCTFTWVDEGPDGDGGASSPLGTGDPKVITVNRPGTLYVELTVTDSLGRAFSSPLKEHDVVAEPSSCGEQACPGDQFPNPASTGTPPGWTPAETRSTTLMVTTPGAVVQDIRFTNGAGIDVRAENVTIRRVELQGGIVENRYGTRCGNGLLVEDVTITPVAGRNQDAVDHYVLGTGGYTARRLEVHDRSDGLRVGGKSLGCGPVVVEDSFINVKCAHDSFHTDGIQGYDGARLTVRNVTIDYEGGCGTSPFFHPRQGNTFADINRLLLVGSAGFMFRLGVPGSVTDLRIEDRSWAYGPIDNACEAISSWHASIVENPVLRGENGYKSTPMVRAQPCNTIGGGR